MEEEENKFSKLGKRVVWTIIYVAVGWILGHVIVLTAMTQFVVSAVHNEPNPKLKEFGFQVSEFAQQIVSFLTFATDEKPFPFSEWPELPKPES